MNSQILQRSFYWRNVHNVARELLGKKLVSTILGKRVSGIIYEVEAYDGEQDQACHAKSGKTTRNANMYEHGGIGYIYFTYGMHWMFNCVTGKEGYPAAVLIRAIQPMEGLPVIESIRFPIARKNWCNGPAKLTKSLGITGIIDGIDLCDRNSILWIEEGISIQRKNFQYSPRIGLGNTPEPWKSKPWRSFVDLSAISSYKQENWL